MTDHSGWFYNFEHPREQERGLDFTEDLYCPGRLDGTLAAGQTVTLIATVETDAARRAATTPCTPRRRARRDLLAQAEVAGGRRRPRDADAGRRPVRDRKVRASRPRDGDRRLPLVHRLGPGHDDRAARPVPDHRPHSTSPARS